MLLHTFCSSEHDSMTRKTQTNRRLCSTRHH
jgi:hypothetical protein